jgi:hypothetical protein
MSERRLPAKLSAIRSPCSRYPEPTLRMQRLAETRIGSISSNVRSVIAVVALFGVLRKGRRSSLSAIRLGRDARGS